METPLEDEHKEYKPVNRNDPRPTEELINLALTEEDEHAAWNAVTVLQFRATREVLEAAQNLCKSERAKERELGANILGQLGVPDRAFPDECLATALELLETDQEVQVLSAACIALGHLHDPRAIGPLVGLKNHPSEDVRYGVVHGLSGQRDDLAIATLIELSADEDSDVRDWATFELGTILDDVDTPQIREALFARLGDPDDDTRGEALASLARRKDERVLVPLTRELEEAADDAGPLVFEAAEKLGDPRLCPVLLKIKALGVEDSYLEKALAACNCESPNQ
jgi:HEAT repeat protein